MSKHKHKQIKTKPPKSLNDSSAVQILCNQKLWRTVSYFIPIIIFLASAAISIYYIFLGSQAEFHSDCTDTIMWANASHESGDVFDKNFKYACFLPFGINLIMQPLISVFGVSLTTHHLGMLAFFILFTGFFILTLREMKIDIRYNLTAASVLLGITFSSEKIREIFWGHTIYYSLGLLFILIGCFLYFRLLNLEEKYISSEDDVKKKKRLKYSYGIVLAVLCIFIMFTATDGISALSIFGLPFLAAIFAEKFTDTKSKLSEPSTIATYAKAVLFAIMIFLGTKLADWWKDGQIASYEDAFSTFSPLDNWVDNALTFPKAWLSLFGVENMENVMFTEPEGIITLIRVILSLMVIVIPIIATCLYNKYSDDPKGKATRIFIWIHWGVTAIIMLGYICGLLCSAPWRLVPVIGTSVMTSLVFICWAISSKEAVKRIVVIITIPFLIVSFVNFRSVAQIPADNYKENVLFLIADELENRGLEYGYATFWNANSVTVISGSDVIVRDVTVDENGVEKRIYQSSRNWYTDQEGQKEYFLLLSDDEYNLVVNYAYDLILKAKDKATFEHIGYNYHLLTFDFNIF